MMQHGTAAGRAGRNISDIRNIRQRFIAGEAVSTGFISPSDKP